MGLVGQMLTHYSSIIDTSVGSHRDAVRFSVLDGVLFCFFDTMVDKAESHVIWLATLQETLFLTII